MSHTTSGNISVFPSANRINYPQSRLTSENNIVGLLQHIIRRPSSGVTNDDCSFVITQTYNANEAPEMEFVIHGYYFKVTDLSGLITAKEPLFAVINLRTQDGFIELAPTESGTQATALDTEGNFVGIDFVKVISSPLGASYYWLQLLDASGHIPEDSKLRFVTNSHIRTVAIDDGDLTPNE